MLKNQYKIWLSPPHLNGNEILHIQEAIAQNWISPYGENIDTFERMLEEYFGVPDVALVNSGTAAIHLALDIIGIGPGDEVIVPTLNFAGCVNPIYYRGATPIFIDSERDTWNMDPELAELAIVDKISQGRKPKAIIAVDLFGIPCQLSSFEALSNKYQIPLIEDAADALGSMYKNKPLGCYGSMGIISFNGNKIITTSGGGALISNNPAYIEKAKHLSNQARTSGTPFYVHDTVGYNYMMSNILAGIGRGQFSSLADRIARRRQINQRYIDGLADIAAISFPLDNEYSFSNRWLSVMQIAQNERFNVSRDMLYEYLKSEGIESRPVWTPMHMQPAYAGAAYYGASVAEELFRNGICLPSGTSMTDAQQDWVINIIIDFIQNKAMAA